MTRIISIMPHGPAYGYGGGARPPVCWTRPDGEIVGFWPREWMDLLGAEILKNTKRFTWEVWQPDPRADKAYSHTLETGVTHRLFAAEERVYGRWPLAKRGIASDALAGQMVEAGSGDRVLILLYGTYGFRLPFYFELLRSLRGVKAPVFMRSGGMFRAPASDLWGLHRPLTYLRTLKEQFALKEALARADVVSEQSSAALAEVRKVYSGRVEKLTLGCDFDFWRPPRSEEKAVARRKLGVANNVKVFFASGNFVPRKQLDRLVEAFVKLGGGGFFLVIAGHGEARETVRLTVTAAPLTATGGALIHPYVEGEALRALYWAADVYVSVATDEGGPASVMKALACGMPVLTTPAGETADSLRECGAGRFVPVKDHAAWPPILADIISGNLPRAMDQAAACARYNWPNVAARYIKIFEELEAEYYGKEDDA